MRKKYFLILFISILSISVSFNAIIFFYSIKIYRQYKKLQIDPSGYLEYNHLNTDVAKKKTGVTRIIFFGDSRIYQWNDLPDLPGCEILNRGIPGDTTSLALLRIERDVIRLNPDIIIIQLGGNDCNTIGVLPEMENYVTTRCENNIGVIVDKLQKKKIRAIVLTIFPFGSVDLYRWPVWSERTRYAITKVNSRLMEYDSANVRVLDCDTIFLERNKMKKEYSRDLLHINRDGYFRLNAFISPYIKDLISGVKP